MENKQDVDGFFYVKAAFFKIKRHWLFFTASIIGFVGLASVINWYSQPVYEVGSIILIDGNQKTAPANPSEEFSFSLFTPESDINNEIQKMKSLELIYAALKKTNSEIAYYITVKGIKEKELYDQSPFYVKIIRDHLQPLGIEFRITPKSESQFNISIEESDDAVTFYDYKKEEVVGSGPFSINQDYNYGDTVKSEFCQFIVLADKEKLKKFKPNSIFSFVFNDLNRLMYNYQNQLKVEQVGKDIQAVSIKMKVTTPQKGIDFINELTRAYMQRNVDKKNFLAETSINYINNELGTIEDSLTINEGDLQKFRSSNKMMQIESLSEQAFKGASDLENQKAELESRARYYDYVYNSLDNEQTGSNLLVPSSMGVDDQVLTGIINEYIRLTTEKNNLVQNKNTLSPYFTSLSSKINVQKKTLLESVQYLMRTNNLNLTSINNRLRKENSKITQLPGTERTLVGIERKQTLNDDIYKYMLRKKAEAQIAKGSSLPDNDILEPAKLVQLSPVAPNKVVNYLIALLGGLLFPFAVFGIKSLTDNTVPDEETLLSLVQLPILGRVYRKKNQKQLSALDNSPRSPISESIRTVRTNIEHFLEGKKNQVILFTSTMGGEGKSFCSLNLANSLALANRKTVLLDFDLRKPNQYFSLNSANKLGVTSFLRGDSAVEDILVSTGIANFDCIGAGDVPSNPAELIDSERTEILINKLKEDYDYVVIDTAPVGLVWETFLLMKYSNLKIFVVREKTTLRKELTSVINELKNKNVENMYCLLNDVDTTDSFYGRQNEYFAKE